jgi:hypothetical protein
VLLVGWGGVPKREEPVDRLLQRIVVGRQNGGLHEPVDQGLQGGGNADDLRRQVQGGQGSGVEPLGVGEHAWAPAGEADVLAVAGPTPGQQPEAGEVDRREHVGHLVLPALPELAGLEADRDPVLVGPDANGRPAPVQRRPVRPHVGTREVRRPVPGQSPVHECAPGGPGHLVEHRLAEVAGDADQHGRVGGASF